jgi:hypothetical protein
MKKNIILFFITILICVLAIEYTSAILVKKILSFKYNPKVYKELSEPQGYTKEIIEFYDQHYKELHHLRGINSHIIKKPPDLIFKKIGDGETKVLIQGDSWAEQYYTRYSKKHIQQYAEELDCQIIEAGVSSYSPSLMTAQLNKISNDFNIKPDYIIAVIDQTDIGDELCRYRNLRQIRKGDVIIRPEPVESNGVYQIQLLIEKYNALYADSFAIIKIYHYLKYRLKSKLIQRRSKKVKCDSNDILGVLKTGISIEDENYIIDVISNYINTSFKNSHLNKLIIVTHPHSNHLNKIYSLNVEELISKAVNYSNFKNKIQIVSFSDELSKASDLEIAGMYRYKDVYSHLNHQYFLDYVLPKVFKAVTVSMNK